MKNYTLEEIKEELNQEIEELEEIDPSWKNCRHCPFQGRCCIDNDIDIREDEWNEIRTLLDDNETIRNKVKDNLLQDRKCYFRTEECCLIHPIRPTNCLYTPYQVIQNIYTGEVEYSLRDETCHFTTWKEKHTPIEPKTSFIKSEKDGHTYLFLNHWYFEYERNSIDGYKLSGKERLMEYFGIK